MKRARSAPSAITFSRRSMYSPRASSRTSILLDFMTKSHYDPPRSERVLPRQELGQPECQRHPSSRRGAIKKQSAFDKPAFIHSVELACKAWRAQQDAPCPGALGHSGVDLTFQHGGHLLNMSGGCD